MYGSSWTNVKKSHWKKKKNKAWQFNKNREKIGNTINKHTYILHLSPVTVGFAVLLSLVLRLCELSYGADM